MDLRFFYAVILTILPVTELRAGLPLAIGFAIDNNIPVFLISSTIILINILLIFFIFYFLDNIHIKLMNLGFYKRTYKKFLKRFQKKVEKIEKKYNSLGFVALILFVSVPLPGTGAWSGSLVSWILGLERKKSILAISIGVIIAGILVILGTSGIIKLFS